MVQGGDVASRPRRRAPFFIEEFQRPERNMKKIIKMREMADNQEGIIAGVSARGEMGRRIREMGLVPHTPIQIRGRAPLKDPVAVRVRDFILTLRNNEADHIQVEVEVPDPPARG